MSPYLLGAVSALWLGVLTSISPCPLATNITAVSFVGRRVGSTRGVLLAGALYTLGRLLTYVALGALLVAGALSAPGVSYFLQKYMNRLLGPVLILTGMLLLGLLKIPVPQVLSGEKLQQRAEKAGLWGAALLGFFFALAFCPGSAALFFGGLVPLAVKYNSPVLYPALYGAGTALPVAVFAFIIALGAQGLGRACEKVALVEKWARRVTGTLFIAVGVYFCLRYVFEAF